MELIELLIRVGAAHAGVAGYAAVVDMSEHQGSAYDLPGDISVDEIVELHAGFGAKPIKSLIDLSIGYRSDGRPLLKLATNCHVGFASTQLGAERLFVRVRPKIDTRRFLELAVIAEVLPEFDLKTEVSHADFADVLHWMLKLFARSMEKLLSQGGVRSTHERVDQVLRNRVRGKLMIPAFMASLAKGRPDRIPCQFSALVIDNPANRLLAWALSAAGKLSRQLVGDTSIDARLTSIERHFRDVSLARPSKSALEHDAPLPPNQRHYADAITIAKMLLKSFHVDSSPGSAPSISLSMNMYDIYERSFWRLLKRREPAAQAKPSWKIDFSESGASEPGVSVRFEPDIYVKQAADRAPLIIDTKWKDAARSYQGEGVIRPSTADVYQISTYAFSVLQGQRDTAKCYAVLLYPSLIDCKRLVHVARIGECEVVVIVMGWNVSRPPTDSVEEIWTYLDDLRRSGSADAEAAEAAPVAMSSVA